MRLSVLVCFLLLVIIPPVPGQAPNQPADESKQPKDNSHTQQQPAKPAAPAHVVKAGTTPNTDGQRTEEKKRDNPIAITTTKPLDIRADVTKDWMDRLNWVLTATLLVVGYFGVRYAKKTLKEIKATGVQAETMIGHANTQAQAALDHVRISELSMIAGDRAYVHHGGFKWISHQRPPDTVPRLFWRIRPLWINTGNTPTRKLRVCVKYELRDSPLPTDTFQFTVDDMADGLLSPKGEVESNSFDIFGEDLAAVASGTKHFYAWGVARYRDVFPNTPERVTKFCCRANLITGDPHVGFDARANPFHISFVMDGPHNCADEDCGEDNARPI